MTEPILALLKTIVLLFGVVLPGASACVYFERKISAWIHYRIGPNRVGPLGLLQPIADVVKLLLKEDIVPRAANSFFHFLAPLISIAIAVATFAIVPFGHYIDVGGQNLYLAIAPHTNVGILLFLALTSVAVYGLTLAGWSSNSKYSLLGGLRSASQMISYELSLGLALVGVLMIAGSLEVNEIVQRQAAGGWNIFYQPLGFVIFLVAAYAETNRAPFDLPEAEPELVGGYHTEYSGMKFGIFFLAEYAAMIASSAIMATLYFGGYHLPFVPQFLVGLGFETFAPGGLGLALLEVGTFTAKVAFFLFVYIWVRWSIPRFRYDQLMKLGWKVLLPLSLVNVAITGILMLLF